MLPIAAAGAEPVGGLAQPASGEVVIDYLLAWSSATGGELSAWQDVEDRANEIYAEANVRLRLVAHAPLSAIDEAL